MLGELISFSNFVFNMVSVLAVVVPVMIVEVFLVVMIILHYRKYFSEFVCYCRRGRTEEELRLETVNRFDIQILTASECVIPKTVIPNSNLVLLLTRLISFGYICGISTIWFYARNSDAWYFFTIWNTTLMGIYFLIASTFSFIEVLYPNRDDKEKINCNNRFFLTENHARLLHILFEVMGGTSILVTILAFSLLNRIFTFWNTSVHFITALTMLVELILNKFYVRYDHLIFNVLWISAYVSLVWILVGSKNQGYPYIFIDSTSFSIIGVYTGILFVDILFYSLWYGFSELKYFVYSRYNVLRKPSEVLVGDEDIHKVEGVDTGTADVIDL